MMERNMVNQDASGMDAQLRKLPDSAKTWLMAMGIGLIILGLTALYAAIATTLVSVLFLGMILIFAGVFQGVFAFTSGQWSGFALHLLLAVLYVLGGIYLILNPVAGAVTLTILLGFLFLASGLFRVVGSISMRSKGWGWALFSGIITTAVGLYVVFNLPAASLFLIGIFVGVDLIFYGVYLTNFAFSVGNGAKRVSTRAAMPAEV
jgi:uncharacterized membrane protein HdeD (DUF308 family)